MLADHYLDDLFNPEGVAIIGASERAGSVGRKVITNLIRSQYAGGLYPVNPKHHTVFCKPCVASVKEITNKVDLAIITTPASTVPMIMQECGERGIRSVIIITAGFSEMGDEGKALEQKTLEIAQQYHIRFIGPNCLGVMRPQSRLNATFDNNFALPGSVALLSQSGAICAAILDWALSKEIGFSAIVSMGNSVDLDFGDILDYLANDPETKSILLYIEGIHYPRRFLDGLRAVARLKPVIAIKAGRNSSGARAVHSHTGALVGDDDVFSAALSRGGAVRVMSIEQLFTAAQVLSSPFRVKGNRLTIVTNGGGAGVMAADKATDLGIVLPTPTEDLITKLNAILPAQWSHQNPIDILGDANPKRYQAVLDLCMQDNNSDALLTILVPVAMSQPIEVAKELSLLAKKNTKPLLACWMGDKQVQTSWHLFADNNIPCYSTPEVAVEAFYYLATYYQNQQLLLQTPEITKISGKTNVLAARQIINAALKDNRTILSQIESKNILAAFEIPVAQTLEARTSAEAIKVATSLGFPVAMKINSPDITHKTDVHGVELNIETAEAVGEAFDTMMKNVKACKPDAIIIGVTIERMYSNPDYRELMIGVISDKVFGPIISVGAGGSLVEIMQDRAVELPPLNAFLARQMIAKTKAMKLLGNFRGKPAVDMNALVNILLRVSEMISMLPEIQEMDINPLLIDEHGAIVVDARFVVTNIPTSQLDYAHMAIHPDVTANEIG